MSNNPYEQRRLFCEDLNAKKPKMRIRINTFWGIGFGISFPMDHYTDMAIRILCFNIRLKWRKR